MRLRLVSSIIVAAVCAAVFQFRTYTSFERVRIRVVKDPIVSHEPQLTLPLPDLSQLGGAPSALILRLRGTSESEVTVTLGERTLGRVEMPAGREVRADLTFMPAQAQGATLTLASRGTGWTVSYLEIANLHGQSRGWIDLVVVPAGQSPAARLAPAVPVVVFVAALAVGWLSRRPPRRLWRITSRTVAALCLSVLALTLVATVVSPYKVLLSAATALLLTALVYVEPIARALLHVIRIARVAVVGPLWRRIRPDPRLIDIGPLPPAREVVVAAGGFVLFTLVLLHDQVRQFGSVPDLGDPLFSIWRMAWISHQIVSDPRHLFDANIFFPDRGALTYSDAMLLAAAPNALLRALGAHPVTAYNLLFLSAFVFSATTAYVLGRSFAFTVPGAWTAGLVFGYYSFRFEHYSHLELQLTGWMPLVLLAIHRIVMAGAGTRYVALGTLSLAAQWYSAMYFGLFLSVYASAFAALLLLMRRRPGREVRSVLAVLGVGTLLALPLAAVYSAYGDQRGERAEVVVETFSAVPGDYLESTDRRALYQRVTRGAARPERQLFPGIVPAALGVAGLVPPFSGVRLAIAGAGLVAFDGSLGTNGLWYPVAYEFVGPFQSVRVPARFAMLVGLSMALLAGAAVTRWSLRASPRRRALVSAALTGLLLADAWPSLKLVPVWRDTPPIYEPLRGRRDAVLIELPLHPIPESFPQNIPSMYFSTWHWTRMVNGYSGHLPETYSEIVTSLAGFPSEETLARAQALGVTHVSVVCAVDGPHAAFGVPVPDAADCADKIRRLDASPRVVSLVRTEWQGAPAHLYELRAPH